MGGGSSYVDCVRRQQADEARSRARIKPKASLPTAQAGGKESQRRRVLRDPAGKIDGDGQAVCPVATTSIVVGWPCWIGLCAGACCFAGLGLG